MKKSGPLLVARSADRFAALGAPPTGMVAGEVQEELEIPASTLSHHLEKLKQVGLVNVRRVSLVFGQYGCTARSARFSLRGMLHAQPRGGPGVVCADFALTAS